MDRENVLSKLAGLTRLPANELKDMWRDLFGKEPPTFNRNFMEARIAYRIQELAFGGDVAKITKRIKNINQHNHDKKFRREAYRPPVGTVLVREYQSIEHRVRVMHDGFEYQGMKFTSLSAVAYKITGTKWNGLAFFGLKSEKRMKL
jgi:hypothetical protein